MENDSTFKKKNTIHEVEAEKLLDSFPCYDEPMEQFGMSSVKVPRSSPLPHSWPRVVHSKKWGTGTSSHESVRGSYVLKTSLSRRRQVGRVIESYLH